MKLSKPEVMHKVEKIKKYIYEQVISQKISKNEAALMLKELYENQGDNNKDIAVIGMDCRYPKANNVKEFWDNGQLFENTTIGSDVVNGQRVYFQTDRLHLAGNRVLAWD